MGEWVDVGIDPYGVKNETRCDSSWPVVGAKSKSNTITPIRPNGTKREISTLSAAQTSAPPRMSMTFPSSVRRSVSQQVMSTCPERI